MIKKIYLKDREIEYELQYKKVKNINLRILPDGKICVSANKYVPEKLVEELIVQKSDFIIKALEKCEKRQNQPKVQYFPEEEIRDVILGFCRKVYPYFEKRGVSYPEIKFRKMLSRWGSCNSTRGILTFNTNLMFAPLRFIEYVVLHEFVHFLQPNHSKRFYHELEKVCPDWKERKKIDV